MSSILYYSKHCSHCRDLLVSLSRTTTKKDVHFVCIDVREKGPDGATHIVLANGQRLLLPPNISTVPSLLLLHHGNQVVSGLANIIAKMAPNEAKVNSQATGNNGEPLAFSSYEMGTNLSDNYSYLDMSADELSAKGNGGTRMMHSYMGIGNSQTIATPPDDYEPNKVGTVDLGMIANKRAEDVRLKG